MAALDFPASPVDGQVYSNWVYSSSKGAWQAKPLTPGQAQPSATAPTSPSNGDQWYNTNDGNLYIYYNDGDTSQWVQVKSNSAYASTLGQTVDALNYGANTNYIINGAFDFWQRGTSWSAPAQGTYTADRWMVENNSGTGLTVSRQPFTPGTSPIPGYDGSYFLRYAVGTANPVHGINNKVEDVRTLAGQTVTLSFWAKAAAETTLLVNINQYFGSGGSSDVFVERTFTLKTEWRPYSYTVTLGSMSGKTIGTNSYLQIRLLNTTNTTFTMDFWGVQLQAGAVATAFHRSAGTIQGELAACQRYYAQSGALSSYTDNAALGTARDGGSSAAHWFKVPLPVPMRAQPTIAFYSYNGTANRISTGAAGAGDLTYTINQQAGNFFNLTLSASCTTSYANWTASAEL